MADVEDYDLLRTDEPSLLEAPPPRRPVGLWIMVAALIIAAGIAAYIAFGGRAPSRPVTTVAQPADAPRQADQPLGGDAAPIVVPPLDESDAVVRELVKQLTSHPRVAAWLTTNGLIRNFTVAVENAAEGGTPARHLRVLQPASGFLVTERDGDLYIDPRGYERYDSLAAAVASIDPANAARLYATLKPRIEEASRELGTGETFDRTLERAIVSLLRTPVRDAPVRLRSQPQGIGYGFADPQLEGLTAAQKQLLRMGPRNARIIQSSLRSIALALGIPAERLR
jgi:hypothetical protein